MGEKGDKHEDCGQRPDNNVGGRGDLVLGAGYESVYSEMGLGKLVQGGKWLSSKVAKTTRENLKGGSREKEEDKGARMFYVELR